jgi:hypothetical protein
VSAIREGRIVTEKTVKTNEEFLGELMMFSKYGQLTQIFIIEAIRNYASSILATPKPTEEGTGFISPIAWHGCAEEVLEKLTANYERK